MEQSFVAAGKSGADRLPFSRLVPVGRRGDRTEICREANRDNLRAEAFAHKLVATTDRAFIIVTKSGRVARQVRINVVPRVLPALFDVPRFRRFMFRTVSQIGVQYRRSALSSGRAGKVRGGDRLPWLELVTGAGGGRDNHAPLASLAWQVHVYGVARQTIQTICRDRGIAAHEFPWSASAERAGLERDAVYLVRPDGYVGLAAPKSASSALTTYLNEWNISGLTRPRR